MAQYRITTPDGQRFNVTAPDGVAEDRVLSTVQEQASRLNMTFAQPAPPPVGSGDVVRSPDPATATQQSLFGAGQPRALDPVQQVGNVVLPIALQAAATGPAGTVAQAMKAPAALGRIAATAGLSAGGQAMRGDSPLSWESVIDTAVAGGTEALFGAARLAPKIGVKALGRPARAYQFATDAPPRALEFIRDRIDSVKRVVIPAIDATKKVTWDEAIEALRTMTGESYRVARAELANVMNMADRQALRPRAGQILKDMTATKRFAPSTFSELAQSANVGLRNPMLRAGAHAVGQQEIETEDSTLPRIPVAVPAAYVAKEAASPLLRAIRGFLP